MAKAKTTKKRTRKKAAPAWSQAVTADTIVVRCGYCGGLETFSGSDAVANATKYIKDDMENNGHDASDYSIYIGKKVELEAPKVEARIILDAPVAA